MTATYTRHTKPVPHPRWTNLRDRAGDLAVSFARAFVVRLLVTVSGLVALVWWLAFAQKQAGDKDAAVALIAVGFLCICALVIRMAVREVERLNKPVRRRRKEEVEGRG